MSDGSTIEWLKRPGTKPATWNPVRGCTRVSEGCVNCYAETMAARFSDPGMWGHGFAETIKKPDGTSIRRWTGKVELIEEMLTEPIRWKSPRTIFANSTSDLFHEALPDEAIDRIFAVMALCPQHTFLVLTKRPERMRAYVSDPLAPHRVAKAADAIAVRMEIEAMGPEELRPIDGYPGYFITDRGRVLSSSGSATCLFCGGAVKGIATKAYCSKKCRQNACYYRRVGRPIEGERSLTEMTPDSGEQGHLRVMLYRDGEPSRELIHRLVLSAFVRQPQLGEQGCHRNGNPGINALPNLRWGDQEGNWSDSKRHGNFRRVSKLRPEQVDDIRRRHAQGESGEALGREFLVSGTQIRNIAAGEQWSTEAPIAWPLRQAWLGISAEDQVTANERIPFLLDTPAAIRFVSAEPLLGPIDFTDFDTGPLSLRRNALTGAIRQRGIPKTEYCELGPRLDWIIVGGESGPKARPMHPQWARDIRDQCQAAGVAYFFKQWGSWWPHTGRYGVPGVDSDHGPFPKGVPLAPDETDPNAHFWPMTDDDQWQPISYRVGKHAAGRLLDGREHNEFPEVRS
jgi:protein gp37